MSGHILQSAPLRLNQQDAVRCASGCNEHCGLQGAAALLQSCFQAQQDLKQP